ncbi:TPA: ABC transporter permease [Stenotrophomonas maltophilia]|jgi:lipopolysaccharide transport system permease protein|uniref:Transport permease protein n=1 Tax=Stenotrophomonas riyadhensis TaxID=2859893 RepID=A0ABT2XI91_9GAMM|nr:ABC transporter permease [Stenotrophomonas sp. CFS3442]MBH1617527.1 ABC transporter permease [Stenotrophomonas maltophilia]MCV0325642.1 ABC transporter permease [Stenotrophomonas sp. CFS3442]HEL3196722.1 ABC transporter permease [Stenotrophomonas maltophilia]HEL4243793.1 ABC transporter permease [Stenotrophomonas maltophilia]
MSEQIVRITPAGRSARDRLLTGPFSALGVHRSLTREMTLRDIRGRYRGASFGLLWSLISPFMMLCVYTLAFGYILKSRWPGASGNMGEFAMILFAGLIVHGFFAEVLTRSPNLIVGNSNLVKRIIFPLHLLPWTAVLSALFHLAANTVVYLVISTLLLRDPHWTVVLLPLVMLPLVMLAVGVSWILSALGVYLRDVGQVMGVVSTAMLFLSSAIIPVSTLPAQFQFVFRINPLTFIIDQVREVAFWGRLPDWSGLGLYALMALAVMYLGFAFFEKARRGFADVL